MRGILSFLDLGAHFTRLFGWLQNRAERKHFKNANKRRPGEPEKPPEPFLRRLIGWPRRHWVLCLVLALLGAGAAAYQLTREKAAVVKTQDLWKQATDQFDRGDWAEAEKTAAGFLQRKERERDAMWMVFRAERNMEVPRTVNAALWLGGRDENTGDDYYELLSYLAGEAPQGAFFAVYGRLSRVQQEEPRFRALMARSLTRRGDVAGAAKLFYGDWAANDDLLREHARMQCRRKTPDGVRAARQDFLVLRARNAEAGLEVLRMLAREPQGVTVDPVDEFPHLEEWIEARPGATIEDRLIAWDQKLAVEKTAGDTAAALLEKYGKSEPGAVAAWLNRHGMTSETILFATRPEADRAQVFGPLVEALVAEKKIPTAKLTLDAPPANTDPIDLAILRVRYATASGDNADQAWQAALAIAGTDKKRNRAIDLASLAIALNRENDHTSAMVAACRHPGGYIPLYYDVQGLLQNLLLQDRVTDVLDILTNLRRFEWANPELNGRLLYVQCLSGAAKPAGVLEEFQSFKAGQPEDAFQRDLAFLNLLAGNAPESIALLEPLERRTAGDRFIEAMLGTALRVAGRGKEAERFFAAVTWSAAEMLPIESRNLKRLLAEVAAQEAGITAPIKEEITRLEQEIATAAKADDKAAVETLKKKLETLLKTQAAPPPAPETPPAGR